jgi:hypothetical protein
MPLGNIDFYPDRIPPWLISDNGTRNPDETENPDELLVKSGDPFSTKPKSSNPILYKSPFFAYVRTKGISRRGVSSQRTTNS